MQQDKFGLVLSGGGAKGAYEIGVWKAIKSADIPLARLSEPCRCLKRRHDRSKQFLPGNGFLV